MSSSPQPTRRQFVVSTAALAASAAVLPSTTNAEPAPASPAPSGGNTHIDSLTRPLTIDVPLNPTWPVLNRFDQSHLDHIALPVGGLGTGCISLGGRGVLRDWELVNKPAYGYQPINTFFSLFTKDSSGKTITKCLEGQLPINAFEGPHGSPLRNHGLPRFRNANFAAAYPFAQVLLSDPDVPLKIRIESFNPFVPADADASGIPVMMLRFVLVNPTNSPIDATVCGTVENFIGWDGDAGKANQNTNEFRSDTNFAGLFMQSKGLDPKSPAWGTLALATTWAGETSHRTDWADLSWGDSLLDFWDDLSADGKLDERTSKRTAPFASLAPRLSVPANGEISVTFLIAWHFPNRLSWTSPERVGNYYCTQYTDAWDAAVKAAGRLYGLERKTLLFVKSLVDSDVPPEIKDACLANIVTLKTQTVFRTEDGKFFGWEGCNDHSGCCHGSCTHVWNYEQATAHLFGDLAKNARYTDFNVATDKRGLMSFRINLPISHATEYQHAAADGQMGTLMRLYREWKLSGDEQFLKDLYPAAKRTLEFAWIPGGWDADKDGVMEGCQHNTMDVEYFGPNPEIGVWYLGALRAMEELSRHLKDDAFADTCRDLFTRGSKWFDANLFNGDYYEQHIVPADLKQIAPGLTNSGDADKAAHPVLQIGAGCLADQLVGQYMAHVCSLGYLLDEKNVRKTLQSIMQYNYRENFYNHFNHLRSYAMADDQGLLVATYPRGHRPDRPFPYCNEVWTGIEYTAAAGMIYEHRLENSPANPSPPGRGRVRGPANEEGSQSSPASDSLLDSALKIITAARNRHDGARRNPYDEEECGHHYARAMASYATLLAYTGFSYHAPSQSLRFAQSDQPTTWFFSTGHAWGTIHQDGANVTLNLSQGSLSLRSLTLGEKQHLFPEPQDVKPGKALTVLL